MLIYSALVKTSNDPLGEGVNDRVAFSPLNCLDIIKNRHRLSLILISIYLFNDFKALVLFGFCFFNFHESYYLRLTPGDPGNWMHYLYVLPLRPPTRWIITSQDIWIKY